MAFSLNQVQLIGNLGQDAEHRFTTNNTSVTNFSLATTESYKDKDGNYQNKTTWHNVIAFGLSDFFKNALKKGKKFYIEGRIQKRDYTDKEGVKRYVVEVVADKFNGIIPLDNREQADHGPYQQPPVENENVIIENPETDDDLPF